MQNLEVSREPPAPRNWCFAHYTSLIFPWVWTILFLAAYLIIVEVYSHKGIFTSSEKNIFNFVSTGLSVFLGLSFYEAFKGLARTSRPFLIRYSDVPARFNENVKEIESLRVVWGLILQRSGWKLWIICLIWLSFNIIAQTLAALIAVTYTISDGTDFDGTYLRNGSVRVTNLTCYNHPGRNDCLSTVIQDQLAHSYGDDTQGPDSTTASDCGNYSDLQSIFNSDQNFPYYCRRDPAAQEFAYRFNEYNPDDTQQIYPHFTDRVITASSGVCNEYWVTGNQTATVGDTSTQPPNELNALNLSYTNGTYDANILIPISALGREGTTYIYRDIHSPRYAIDYGFGPRGLTMWAYSNLGESPYSNRLFECPVTVKTVTNVQNPAHNISDALAREAAASIALQGQFRGSLPNAVWTQWQWYSNGHPWEIHYHNQSRVGANIAEHAIVSLAQMVKRNPTIQTPGSVPYLGSKLSVNKYFKVLLAVILISDTLLILLSIILEIKGGGYEYLAI